MGCEVCGRDHQGEVACTHVGAEASGQRRYKSLVGTMVGGYRIESELARGGMGVVYRAQHPLIGTRAAVKVLRDELCGHRELADRFLTEARAAVAVNHENAARIFDLATLPDGRPCIVMEFLEGETLEQRLRRGTMTFEALLPVLRQLCDVLSTAHARGVVHRDVKAENVLLATQDGEVHVKLLDFGVAKTTLVDQTGTIPGMVLGTPEYMAPEQALGELVDSRADLYALGVLAYRALAGRFPFDAATASEAMLKRLMEPPRYPVELAAPVAEVVLKMLAREREHRFQSAREVAQALEGAASRLTSGHRAAPPFEARVEGRKVLLSFGTREAFAVVEREQLVHGRLYIPSDAAVPEGALTVRFLVAGQIVREQGAEIALRPTPEQARGWGLPPGVGLALKRPAAAPPAKPEQPGRSPGWTGPDEQLVRGWVQRADDTHYDFLGIPWDADTDTVRGAMRHLERQILRLRTAGPTAAQNELLHALALRFDRAQSALGSVENRAQFDAQLGNFKGVARAIASGLRADRLDAMRADYCARYPVRVRQAAPHRLSAEVHLRSNEPLLALDCFERALALDPLHFEDQRRYWALKRRMHMGPRAVVQMPGAEGRMVADAGTSGAGKKSAG